MYYSPPHRHDELVKRNSVQIWHQLAIARQLEVDACLFGPFGCGRRKAESGER